MALPVAPLLATALSAATLTSPCPGADVSPSAASIRRVEAATLCLVNQQRAAHGLRPMARNGALRLAARGYAGRLVRHRFFSHVAPSGETPAARARVQGYARGARSWSVAENLASGTGSLSTPAATVAGWMASPGHRANLLRPALADAGIGVARGTPQFGGGGATFVALLGHRRG